MSAHRHEWEISRVVSIGGTRLMGVSTCSCGTVRREYEQRGKTVVELAAEEEGPLRYAPPEQRAAGLRDALPERNARLANRAW